MFKYKNFLQQWKPFRIYGDLKAGFERMFQRFN